MSDSAERTEYESTGTDSARLSPSSGPVVTALATTPVKGLRICARDELVLEKAGVPENRRFYLVDERGRMVNGKRIGTLSAVRAEYDLESAELILSFPDGSQTAGVVELGVKIETRFFSRTRLAHVVVGPWAAALSSHTGQELTLVEAPAQDGAGVDRGRAGSVSLISQASVLRLEGLAGGRSVDPRRFRMLIEVAHTEAHEEDEWVGRTLRIGAAQVVMHGHVGRCLVTSQAPDSGIVDLPTLELLSYRRGLPTTEPLAFGIFGEVLEPGPVRLGDAVMLE
jgi:uncharacterized protein YcbX